MFSKLSTTAPQLFAARLRGAHVPDPGKLRRQPHFCHFFN
jgi:hypothetical protein